MADTIPECDVVSLWLHLVRSGAELTTVHGAPVRVIYPGRLNNGQGPDFCDAVVGIGQRIYQGDIEVHVRSRDWQAHCHHRDTAYDRVVLHVVMRHNGRSVTRLSSGSTVPVVTLDRYSGVNSSIDGESTACVGIVLTGNDDRLGELLDNAGMARFLDRVGECYHDLETMEPGQVVYRGIMGALGYAHNKLPFLELAERVPLYELEEIAHRSGTGEECLASIQACLIGTAGLLPGQRWGDKRRDRLDDDCVAGLEDLWNTFGDAEVMSPDEWHLFRVRPNNSPVRRLAAMSYLVCRYRENGLLSGLLDSPEKEPWMGVDRLKLENRLVVNAGGYWANRFDFGWGSLTSSPVLLGRQRAADIVVNVLLPFMFARGQSAGRSDLAAEALAIYGGYPRLAVNTVEKHMKAQFGVTNTLIHSARRQQGLLHIYKTRCIRGKCPDCELGQVSRVNGKRKNSSVPLQDSLRLGMMSRSGSAVSPAQNWK
ncbi:MAG TPA: DUF2851 family protein [Dehalococcoidia bacterium]|nr:DUF2851 family protein [Dehalococcoidia bacterium]